MITIKNVTLDEVQDKTRYKDSKLATEFAAAIFKKILPFLGVYPSGDIDYSAWGFEFEEEEETVKDGETTDEGNDTGEPIDDSINNVANDPMNDEYDAAVFSEGEVTDGSANDSSEAIPNTESDVNSE